MPPPSPVVPESYEAAVVEHLVWGRARSRLLEDVRRDRPWNVDLTTGRLSIGDDLYDANILGTYASGDGTLLWGWENPGAPDWGRSLGALSPLRALAGEKGYPLLGQRMVAAHEANVNELALVCGELAGGHPVFVGVHDAGAVILLVTSLALAPETLSPACYGGIFFDVAAMTRAPLQACVTRFAERAGFAVTPVANGIAIERRDASLVVAFDALGRVGGMSGQLRPA